MTAPPYSDHDTPPEHQPRRAHTANHIPHNVEAEAALLGAMLLKPVAIDNALGAGIEPADFYKPGHAHTYETCIDLHNLGHDVDAVTVAHQLDAKQLPPPADTPNWTTFLIVLTANTPAISKAPTYARIVKQTADARRALHLLAEAYEQGVTKLRSGEPAADVIGDIANDLHNGAETAGETSRLFATYTMRDLAELDREIRWLVTGMYVTPTYGMTAGEMKTGKSTISNITAVSVAAGLPVFDKFATKQAAVVIYVGEGGQLHHARTIERVALAMGVDDWHDLPIYCHYDIAPINSSRFQRTLRRDLDRYQPGLVIIDPYYTFHGGNSDARNLHEEAEVLNAVSKPCVDAGAVLDIVNHFNRGQSDGLKRITMAGGGEWVDSWRLLTHRKQRGDSDTGLLELKLEIGSRQWGGSTWDLDINLGTYRPDLGSHDGPITWEIHRPVSDTTDEDTADRIIIDKVTRHPFEFTRDQLAEGIKPKAAGLRAIERLEQRGVIVPQATSRGGAGRPANCYGPTTRREISA